MDDVLEYKSFPRSSQKTVQHSYDNINYKPFKSVNYRGMFLICYH